LGKQLYSPDPEYKPEKKVVFENVPFFLNSQQHTGASDKRSHHKIESQDLEIGDEDDKYKIAENQFLDVFIGFSHVREIQIQKERENEDRTREQNTDSYIFLE
jgi:hypothetical protein